jgi:hypothetical protein
MDFQKELESSRQKAKQAVRDFVEGAASGNLDYMAASFEALDYGECDGGGWVRAMRAATRLNSVPRATQEFFLQVYLTSGDHIRQEGNDLVLADGLRVLLPKYKGPAMRLYRGDSFRNRSRRTYGLSWTACADIARDFAETGSWRASDGGSALLETLAPPDAIICAPALLDDRYAEKEYIVDRRRLTSVKAIERFTQLSHDDLRLARSGNSPRHLDVPDKKAMSVKK